MPSAPDRLPPPAFLGIPVQYLARCSSTMDIITARAVEGAPEGTCVTTDEQTAGRGRAGRIWAAPAGSSLLLSALLRPTVSPERLTQLSILLAVCVARVVETHTGRHASIKWPNDVVIAGAKISGVLASARFPAGEVPEVTVGIGLNVNIPPAALSPAATSLLALTGHQCDRSRVLHELLAALEAMYGEFLAGDIAVMWQDATDRLAYRGEVVQVIEGTRAITGTLLGLAYSGALCLRLADGREREIWSGDLARGPRPVAAQRAQTA